MKVKYLIEALQAEDPEADVLVCMEDMHWPGYDVSRLDSAEQEIGIMTANPTVHQVVVLS